MRAWRACAQAPWIVFVQWKTGYRDALLQSPSLRRSRLRIVIRSGVVERLGGADECLFDGLVAAGDEDEELDDVIDGDRAAAPEPLHPNAA